MSLEHVLLVVGTAVTASPDDPRIAATTDGTRVWVTTDGGGRWRLAAVPLGDDEPAPLVDDPEADDPFADEAAVRARRSVHSLAILDDHLYVATRAGIYTVPVHGGRVRVRNSLVFEALAVEDRTLWAAGGETLHRSDDAGRTWHPVIKLPTRDVRSLGVAGGGAIIGSGWDCYLLDLGDGASVALAVGPQAVTASADGSFWRASRTSVERSTDGGDSWHPAAARGGVAVAVGASRIWVATERVIERLPHLLPPAPEVPEVPEVPETPALVGAPDVARYLPQLTARVAFAERIETGPHLAGRAREAVFEIWLRWELDRAPAAELRP